MNKEKREIIYSVIILFFVPLLLAVNTLLMTQNVRKDFDTELRRKADIVNTVIAQTVQSNINSKSTDTTVNDIIQKIKTERPEINAIRVVSNDGKSSYSVIASTINEDKVSKNDSLQYDIVTNRKQSVAKLVEVQSSDGSNRAWEVATPIVNNDQQVTTVVVTSLLTGDVQSLIDKTFTRAFIVVVASIVATFALLAYHFKFVAYADLLRKQKENNQTMTDFLSVATHELKAPMTVIKGYTASALDGDFGVVSDEMRIPLHEVQTQADRLTNLVTDLLNISRIEQGKLTFDIQPISVQTIIRSILQTYSQKAAQKNIQLLYSPETDVHVMADAGRVQEIMTNLIDNAIKYSVKGTVTITHTIEGSMLKTSVRDTGIGMTAEERSRLFQRFYRVKNEQTKNISGTGLGLWIIKQYIEKMGGKIEVDSLVGTGTEFSVWLKIVDKPKK